MEIEQDEISIVGLLSPLWSHRRIIVVATVAMTGLAVALSAVHFVSQPTRWTATLQFRPTFDGAALGRYPNGLPFAPSDITDRSVLDEVFDRNKVQDLCPFDAYHTAFFVEQQSSELQLIDADFQSQLADPKLSVVERQRLMDQYRARRSSAPVQYRLTFIRPDACRNLPSVVIYKMLDEMLLTWAETSENKRGVLKQRVDVLTPGILDVTPASRHSLFARANLLWTNIDRIIHNITEVDGLPGAGLIRVGKDQVSLAEVKVRMEDLQHSHLDAIMSSIGQRDSTDVRWIENALATAEGQQQVAHDRAQANLDALREYSNAAGQVTGARRDALASPAEPGMAVPQLDKSFIEQIVDMSAPNTSFRQELTTNLVKATLEAVESESLVNHYRQMLKNLQTSGGTLSADEVSAALNEITAQGKELTRQFNEIYNEWSRVSLRPGAAMYRTETPASVQIVRRYSLFNYLTVIGIVFFVTLLITALAAITHTHLWPAIVAKR